MAHALTLAMDLEPLWLPRAAGLELDPWQRRVLYSQAQYLILNASRQAGKSTVVACMAVHEALFRPPALVPMFAPSERQSGELFRVTKHILKALGEEPSKIVEESVLRVELANGSRILALPGSADTVRGLPAPRLILVDEASRCPDELFTAISPMLAVSGGRLVLLSTPNGKQGYFHREWTQGQGWERHQVTAGDCPRISAEYLASERARMTASQFQQEFQCVFSETDEAVFAYADIQRCLNRDLKPWRLLPEDEYGIMVPDDLPEDGEFRVPQFAAL